MLRIGPAVRLQQPLQSGCKAGGASSAHVRCHRPTLDELLAGATERQPIKTADSKSGALFERVRIGGETFVVKHLHADDDWIQRVTGDLGCRPAMLWRAGVLDELPDCFDHAIVGVATGLGRGGFGRRSDA